MTNEQINKEGIISLNRQIELLKAEARGQTIIVHYPISGISSRIKNYGKWNFDGEDVYEIDGEKEAYLKTIGEG